ncbi:MAG: CHASE2 domain-containing protein [Candidatus Omnitrophica bacterium]|nr:CHASE2 domain-containing protein [Candidatus Omnitrophota bacterium]
MVKLRNGDLKLVVGFAASLVVLIFLAFDGLKPLELLSYDLRFKLKPFHKSSVEINIAEIAEDTIQALGRWPFARKFHGAFISVVSKSKPKGILYDVLFTEPSEAIDDQTLEAALKTSGLVYLPYAFELEDTKGKIEYGKEFRPLPVFARWAKGEGHINIQPDADGVIRRIPLVIERDGKMYPSVALELVLQELGTDFKKIKVEKGKWIYIPRHEKSMIRVPIDDQYQMLINWNGPWKKTFHHISFVEAIQAYKQMTQGVEPVINLESFKDKFCLVGLTAIGLTDLKPIPIEPVYPGVGVHATVIQNLLEENWILPLGKKENGAILLILTIITSLGLLRKRPVPGAIFTLITVLIYLVIAYFALAIWGIWISLVYPIAAILANYFATTLYSQIALALEKFGDAGRADRIIQYPSLQTAS